MSVAVIDAALLVDVICDLPAADGFRAALNETTVLAAPAHLDAEVLSALGRLERAGQRADATQRVAVVGSFDVTRWPLPPLLAVAWSMRHRVALRDALYVALAASLGASLISTDRRLRAAAADIVHVVEPDGPTLTTR